MRRTIVIVMSLILLGGSSAIAFAADEHHENAKTQESGATAYPCQGRTMGVGMMQGAAGMMGTGSGMMGMGPGMMGMGPGMMEVYGKLSPDQQDKLKKLHVGAMQAMAPKMIDLQTKSLALSEAFAKFPLEPQAVKKQYEAVVEARRDMFESMLGFMAQSQQIVGKDNWKSMQEERGGPVR